ncbi:MAG: hypothetical protein DRG30_02780 [Epsilonproteobacteria bacterium]|nr:MAG: hypothetical protein DRG30_02780 [Campylobacterota bacterium]
MINPQELYREINVLENSIQPNEAKANNIRKLFEKLLLSIIATDSVDKHIPLYKLINFYTLQKNGQNIQYICLRLKDDLNHWSHHQNDRLNDSDLNDYFARFKNIVRVITGKTDTSSENTIKEFSLDDINLNPKQKEAVQSDNKITLVNAGPGTGKTYLIAGRILEEIRKNPNQKIFGLSFTNKASDGLQHKIDDRIYSTNLIDYRDNILTGTIHSFTLNMIQQYYESREQAFDFIVIDEAEFKDIQDEFGNNTEKIELYLTENKMLTFDKIITMFINTMKNNEEFQKFVADKLDEIIIDEAQDLDKLQYEILYLLYLNNKDLKLFFVGDQRQNIYAFKGGSLNNRLEYFKDKKDLSIVNLEHSYRCPQNILSFVNHFEFSDCKNIELNNAAGLEGNRLTIEEYDDKEDEGTAIAKLIKSQKEEGAKLSEIAIIYTSTFYFKEILEAFNAFEIPFKVFGGQYFIDPHIRLLRLVLNLIYTNNSYALKSIQTLLISNELEGKNIDEVLTPLADMDVSKKENYRTLRTILRFTKEQQNNKEKTPLDIVTKFIELAQKEKLFDAKILESFYSLKMIIENDLTLDNYNKFKLSFTPNHPELGQFYSRSDEIVPSEFYEKSGEYVTVTTVHSAKGLEWDYVIIPGMAQDSFPRWFSDDEARKKELPNEVKKFYVACTRSKSHLYFTRPKRITVKSKKNGQYYTFDRVVSEFVARLK